MRVSSARSAALLILAAVAPACDRPEPAVHRSSAGAQVPNAKACRVSLAETLAPETGLPSLPTTLTVKSALLTSNSICRFVMLTSKVVMHI